MSKAEILDWMEKHLYAADFDFDEQGLLRIILMKRERSVSNTTELEHLVCDLANPDRNSSNP